MIGASGWLGGAVARELLARGHEVTAIGRDSSRLAAVEGARAVAVDVNDREALAAVLAGHDAVVCSVTDRTTDDRSIIPRTASILLEVLPQADVRRLLWVGGGGSLEIEPGERAVDQPGFPEQYKAEALAQAEALAILRDSNGDVDWTYLSPPMHHLEPGEKTGGYRVQGGDSPVVGENGEGRISSGDLASALVDELEQPQFARQRFTAGS